MPQTQTAKIFYGKKLDLRIPLAIISAFIYFLSKYRLATTGERTLAKASTNPTSR
jgi:hypothetical protein